jgi:hypothetical protein
VWILIGLAPRVVLAVDGSPRSRHHARCHPQPETEEMAGNRMQVKRPVCLATVQVDRHADDRDVRQQQSREQDLPPQQRKQAV